jgi:hypothetical protein
MVGPMTTVGMLVHPQVAVYGGQNNLLVVVLSGISAAAKKYGGADLNHPSAAGLSRGFLIMGFKDVQTFPPGAIRASMVCGQLTAGGVTAIFCERPSATGIAMTMYFNGIASSVSDAASKTNQILAKVGGWARGPGDDSILALLSPGERYHKIIDGKAVDVPVTPVADQSEQGPAI